jgi:hypothetical protein
MIMPLSICKPAPPRPPAPLTCTLGNHAFQRRQRRAASEPMIVKDIIVLPESIFHKWLRKPLVVWV